MSYKPPYRMIADQIRKGQVVPFLGAGVNFGQRPEKAEWRAKDSAFLPSGVELSHDLADWTEFPSDDPHERADLAKVSSYYVQVGQRRSTLRKRLHELFDHDFAPCDIHHYLAEVARNTPLLIVTTNYDDLTERAFKQAGVPFDLVIYPTDKREIAASILHWPHGAPEPEAIQPNRLGIDLETTTVIYKMHGTIDRLTNRWDSYVITEDDYIDFLARMMNQTAVPAQFYQHFHSRQFLFLGYGLSDWNLRLVLNKVQKESASNRDEQGYDEEDGGGGWAIQRNPTMLEEKLWGARKVGIYDVDINDFVAGLREEQG